MKLVINLSIVLLLLQFISSSNGQQLPTSYPTPILSSSEEETPTPYPSPRPIQIDNELIVVNGFDYRFSANGYFGDYYQLSQLNFTVSDNYYDGTDKEMEITFLNSTYVECIAPLGYSGYQVLKIYNSTNYELLYRGFDLYYYIPPSPSSPWVNISSVQLTSFNGTHSIVEALGNFGYNSFYQLNITVGKYAGEHKTISTTYINSTYFSGFVPLGFEGHQDIRIHNKSNNNQLIYCGYNLIYFQIPSSSSSSESPSPSPIFIQYQLYAYNGQLSSGLGYFGTEPWYLSMYVGNIYNYQKADLVYINSTYFEFIAPFGFTGYQDIIIHETSPYTNNSYIVYYGNNMIYYLDSTPTPSTTPTPIITCEYSPYGFVINSTERIECKGRGQTYCETGLGSTCSTDSNNSTIKCTTGRSGSSSFYCIGNDIECTSSYVTCSIKKPQSSYLLVNGVEQKSNYYDHSKQQDEEYYNNNNNSSSASIIYSSLSAILLSISSILIIF